MKSLRLNGTNEQLTALQHSKDAAEVGLDPRLKLLLGARPAQIDQWVENNVTTLNEAQEAIKLILQALVVLGRREFK